MDLQNNASSNLSTTLQKWSIKLYLNVKVTKYFFSKFEKTQIFTLFEVILVSITEDDKIKNPADFEFAPAFIWQNNHV